MAGKKKQSVAPESPLDRRPIVVAVAGPNGAGKSTFFRAHLEPAGLRFVNADELARELKLDAYEAARLAGELRLKLVERGESFVFETVFSDPVGDKIAFLKRVEQQGYTVVLCFIGISSPDVSNERVAMRVLQGGHDVPREKIFERYPRVLANLKIALRELPHVWVFDNGDLRTPYRLVCKSQEGKLRELNRPLPKWLDSLLPKAKR